MQNSFKNERIHYYFISQEWEDLKQGWLIQRFKDVSSDRGVSYFSAVQQEFQPSKADMTITRRTPHPPLPGVFWKTSPSSSLTRTASSPVTLPTKAEKQDRTITIGSDQSQSTGLPGVYIKTEVLSCISQPRLLLANMAATGHNWLFTFKHTLNEKEMKFKNQFLMPLSNRHKWIVVTSWNNADTENSPHHRTFCWMVLT